MRHLLSLVIIFTFGAPFIFSLAACSDSAPKAEPDRIVGITLRCEQRQGSLNTGYTYTTITGAACAKSRITYRNQRQLVTVRTSSGGSYQVEADEHLMLEVGGPWPPGAATQ